MRLAALFFIVVIGWLAQGPRPMNPYQVGAGIGVLSWLTFYFSDQPIGASSFYANVAGKLGEKLAAGHTRKLKYFQQNQPDWLGWQSIFILSAIVGAFLAAWSAGDLSSRWLPELWTEHFGEGSYTLRFLSAFGGGVCMAFGARLAGGCTSGHGISGTMQLAVSSWIMVVSLFAGGIFTAHLLFGGP